MQNPKVKISQKDFDDIYEIEGITEETPSTPEPKKEDTTPESILNEEEQTIDDAFFETLNVEEEQ